MDDIFSNHSNISSVLNLKGSEQLLGQSFLIMNVKKYSTSYAKCQSATVILNGNKCYLLDLTNKEGFLENMAFKLGIEG